MEEIIGVLKNQLIIITVVAAVLQQILLSAVAVVLLQKFHLNVMEWIILDVSKYDYFMIGS